MGDKRVVAETMDWILETRGLTKIFGSTSAVDDLNLEVDQEEVVAFLGPNGAGKTTTIRMLAGMIAPTSGSATVCGISPNSNPELLHERVGLLTETPGFYEWMSAWENLQFFGRFYPIDPQAQAEKYLRFLGLWERRGEKVGRYSKGMKQRLAVARALLHEPQLLFLDEPTAGLDPEAARDLRQLLKELRREGRTIFLCTHNLEEAEELADRIAFFRTRMIALDRSDRLRQRLFQPRLVLELERPDPTLSAALKALPYVCRVEMEGNRLFVSLTDFEKERPVLIARVVELGGKILSASEETHTLEEVYLALMASPGDKAEEGSR